MLDVVFVAHRDNYSLLAHQGLDPKISRTEPVPLGALPSAVRLIGVPGKVVLSLEGGTHNDFADSEMYLQSQALAWQIVHNKEGVTSYYETMMRGLQRCQSQLVAVIPAWIEVVDPQWVQRMIWAIGHDPTCLLCGTGPEQGVSRDLAPHLMAPRLWPGGEFFVARRDKLMENLRLCLGEGDFHQQLAESAAANGWRLWAHPGVRFKTHEHEAHERKTVGQEIGAASDSDS